MRTSVKRRKIRCLGEGVIDLISENPGKLFNHVERWKAHFGGAPPNTALAAALLGHDAAWLGCRSADSEGLQFCSELRDRGVNVEAVRIVSAPMRKAWVLLDEQGDRHFHKFSRDCADERLSIGHLPVNFPGDTDILHVGSISLAFESSAQATLYAIRRAREAGTLVSCDVNVRTSLWPNDDACRARIAEMMKLCDLVKMSREDLVFFTQDADKPAAWQVADLCEEYEMPLLVVTLDQDGAVAFNRYGGVEVPVFKGVQIVDTTGAGDATNAGLFDGVITLLDRPENADRPRREVLQNIVSHDLRRLLTRACGLGSLACTKTGAWSALPNRQEWETFLSEHGYAA